MQIIYNFRISPVKYHANGHNNKFPVPDSCPYCHDRMKKHGFYVRHVLTRNDNYYELFIRRYICQHCGLTISILPSFLLPHFQRSLEFIFYALSKYVLQKKFVLARRTLFFYYRRFRLNISGMLIFFRETSFSEFSLLANKEAIKLIEIIAELTAPTFSQRYHNHLNKSFMAL